MASFYNDLDRHMGTKGLECSTAFGGKYNGTVAWKVMGDPANIYEGTHKILKR